jgi:hypothetical protein
MDYLPTLPMTSVPANLSQDEFVRANERSLAVLRTMHPHKPETDLVDALRQTVGPTEAAGKACVIAAALLLLD